MFLKIDTSGLKATAALAEEMFSPAAIKQTMGAIVDRWAGWARTHRTYRDRTGFATAHTVGRVGQSLRSYASATLEMQAEYSSYLAARNFTQFDQAAENCARRLTEVFEQQAARLSKR